MLSMRPWTALLIARCIFGPGRCRQVLWKGGGGLGPRHPLLHLGAALQPVWIDCRSGPHVQTEAVLHIEGGYCRRRDTKMRDAGGMQFTVGTPLSDHATLEQVVAFISTLHSFQPGSGDRLRLSQVQGLTGPSGTPTHLRPADMPLD